MQEAAHVIELRLREEFRPEKGIEESNHNRAHRVAVLPSTLILMPDVRKIGADENEIAITQRRDVVADDPMALALQRERDLKFGMKMPARSVVRTTNHLAVE